MVWANEELAPKTPAASENLAVSAGSIIRPPGVSNEATIPMTTAAMRAQPATTFAVIFSLALLDSASASPSRDAFAKTGPEYAGQGPDAMGGDSIGRRLGRHQIPAFGQISADTEGSEACCEEAGHCGPWSLSSYNCEMTGYPQKGLFPLYQSNQVEQLLSPDGT